MKRITLLCGVLGVIMLLPALVQADDCVLFGVSHGHEGEASCFGFCEAGLVLAVNNICSSPADVGGDGQLALALFTCDHGNMIDPLLIDHCKACGGDDELLCANVVNGPLACVAEHTINPHNILTCTVCGGARGLRIAIGGRLGKQGNPGVATCSVGVPADNAFATPALHLEWSVSRIPAREIVSLESSGSLRRRLPVQV